MHEFTSNESRETNDSQGQNEATSNRASGFDQDIAPLPSALGGPSYRGSESRVVSTTHSKVGAKSRLRAPVYMASYFAILNVVMYVTINKFWIGGSSFLPMIGKLGDGYKFLFAFLVNIGVMIGAFIGAYTSGEFRLRAPKKADMGKAIVGGILIGMGVTVAPGTCTTAFVTGMPMLSVSSFLSAAGIFIGAYMVYSRTLGRR